MRENKEQYSLYQKPTSYLYAKLPSQLDQKKHLLAILKTHLLTVFKTHLFTIFKAHPETLLLTTNSNFNLYTFAPISCAFANMYLKTKTFTRSWKAM